MEQWLSSHGYFETSHWRSLRRKTQQQLERPHKWASNTYSCNKTIKTVALTSTSGTVSHSYNSSCLMTAMNWLQNMFPKTLCLTSLRLHNTLQVFWCCQLQEGIYLLNIRYFSYFLINLLLSSSTVYHGLKVNNSSDQACASSTLLILARGHFITLFFPHLTSQTKYINFLQQDHRNDSYHKMLWAVNQNKHSRITAIAVVMYLYEFHL